MKTGKKRGPISCVWVLTSNPNPREDQKFKDPQAHSKSLASLGYMTPISNGLTKPGLCFKIIKVK